MLILCYRNKATKYKSNPVKGERQDDRLFRKVCFQPGMERNERKQTFIPMAGHEHKRHYVAVNGRGQLSGL